MKLGTDRPDGGKWVVISVHVLALTASLVIAYRPVAGQSVSAEGGPLRDVSRPIGEGSRPVHERGNTVSEASVGSMRSGPVSESSVGSMKSGPVSDVSSGPVTSRVPMSGGGSMAEHSSGAVKNELHPSIGEELLDLDSALRPLQQYLREMNDEVPNDGDSLDVVGEGDGNADGVGDPQVAGDEGYDAEAPAAVGLGEPEPEMIQPEETGEFLPEEALEAEE